MEELWESMISVTKRLLYAAKANGDAKPTFSPWSHCVLEHWHRTQTRPALEAIMTNQEANNNAEKKKSEDDFVVQDLVAI